MADRYIKHLATGNVFIYQSHWMASGDFVEVANLQGDPIDAPVEEAPQVEKKPVTKGKKAKASDLDDLDLDPAQSALNADASRGM